MSKIEVLEDEIKDVHNVRWSIPGDAMKIIIKHKRLLELIEKREVTREEAAIDLIRNRRLPRTIILHD